MKASEIYPSKYLKTDDLQGKSWVLTVKAVEMEDSFGEDKPVLYFDETDKKFTVQPSNWRILVSELAEDETDNWIGASVTLSPVRRKIAGELKNVIDITGATLGSADAPKPVRRKPAQPPAEPDIEEDEIPF